MNIGPTRIILINSGKYQYCNVSIDEAVHLVGANNAGKTSLIAVLQFLYVDNENCMFFTHPMDETKRYYFKGQYSYVLFECLTSNGYQVVGVRGLGMGGAHERFSYMGSFSLEDFYNADGTTRSSAEVRVELADRNYTVLKPKQLRAALTGVGDSKGVSLGLLPIKDQGGYEKIRNLYHNLLNLSHVGQKELKSALVHVAESDFRTKNGIDLEDAYSAGYERVIKGLERIKTLKEISPTIEKCVMEYDERISCRSDMVVGYQKISELFSVKKKENGEKKSDICDRKGELEDEIKEDLRRRDVLEEKLQVVIERIGALKGQLTELGVAEAKFSGYSPDIEIQIMKGLEVELEKIKFNLVAIKEDPLEVLEKRLFRKTKELVDLKNRLANVENSVATYLRSEFSDEEIGQFFTLYNHRLLGMKVADDGLIVKESDALVARIRAVLARIKEGTYADESVQIKLEPHLWPDISKFLNREEMQKDILLVEKRIAKDEALIVVAREQALLLGRKEELSQELKKKGAYHHGYISFTKSLENKGELEKELGSKDDERGVLYAEKKRLGEDVSAKKKESRIGAEKIIEIDRLERECVAKIHELVVPDADWQVDLGLVFDEDDLAVLISNHFSYGLEENRLSMSLQEKLNSIERTYYSALIKSSEQETINSLKGEIEGLAEQEKTVMKLWDAVWKSLATNMRDMLKDLGVLKSAVSEFNRKLAKVPISDLGSFKIIVVENQQIIGLMQDIVKTTETSLFSSVHNSTSTRSVDDLQNYFRAKGKIEVSDLFSLNFEVMKNGNTKAYTELKSIESEGTTVTIKVLVNIMLIKGLLAPSKKVLIPFFLDEVSKLDPDNLGSIVAQSVSLGFTPIVASPEPMDVISRFYTLRGGLEGLYVDDRSLGIIERLS
ncbi:hypothetical protein [Desulfotalea psychrophila]|nr:hypothetical protein [Desulfotalea psychrophila]